MGSQISVTTVWSKFSKCAIKTKSFAKLKLNKTKLYEEVLNTFGYVPISRVDRIDGISGGEKQGAKAKVLEKIFRLGLLLVAGHTQMEKRGAWQQGCIGGGSPVST